MSAKPPIPITIVAIVCGVLVWAPLVVLMSGEPLPVSMVVSIAFGVLVWVIVFFGGLIVRDTSRRRGMWGINIKRLVCSQCGTPLRRLTTPSWRQVAYGGWTCHECGFESNKWGRPVKEQNTLAKWAVLPIAENAENGEHQSQPRDERIRNVNDQTQRGDAS